MMSSAIDCLVVVNNILMTVEYITCYVLLTLQHV